MLGAADIWVNDDNELRPSEAVEHLSSTLLVDLLYVVIGWVGACLLGGTGGKRFAGLYASFLCVCFLLTSLECFYCFSLAGCSDWPTLGTGDIMFSLKPTCIPHPPASAATIVSECV